MSLLKQNVFNTTLKSFDDNKVLKKLSIGYANICSSVHDHRQQILRSLIGSGRTKESKEINKKEAQKHLKRTAPEVKVLLKTKRS